MPFLTKCHRCSFAQVKETGVVQKKSAAICSNLVAELGDSLIVCSSFPVDVHRLQNLILHDGLASVRCGGGLGSRSAVGAGDKVVCHVSVQLLRGLPGRASLAAATAPLVGVATGASSAGSSRLVGSSLAVGCGLGLGGSALRRTGSMLELVLT